MINFIKISVFHQDADGNPLPTNDSSVWTPIQIYIFRRKVLPGLDESARKKFEEADLKKDFRTSDQQSSSSSRNNI